MNGVSTKYTKPAFCSGIYIILKKLSETEFQIEIQANNERDVLSIENIDCPRMLIDLEVSCASLKTNIEIKNLSVPKGQKKLR